MPQPFAKWALLVQSYHLTKRYPIYFCSRNNAVWIQKSGRAANPIHPDRFGRCGAVVQ